MCVSKENTKQNEQRAERQNNLWILINYASKFLPTPSSHMCWCLAFWFYLFWHVEEGGKEMTIWVHFFADPKWLEMKTRISLLRAPTINRRSGKASENKTISQSESPNFVNILYLYMWHAELWCCFCVFFLGRAFLFFAFVLSLRWSLESKEKNFQWKIPSFWKAPPTPSKYLCRDVLFFGGKRREMKILLENLMRN